MTEEAFFEESAVIDDTTDEDSEDSTELTEGVDGGIEEPDACQEQESGETGEETDTVIHTIGISKR